MTRAGLPAVLASLIACGTPAVAQQSLSGVSAAECASRGGTFQAMGTLGTASANRGNCFIPAARRAPRVQGGGGGGGSGATRPVSPFIMPMMPFPPPSIGDPYAGTDEAIARGRRGMDLSPPTPPQAAQAPSGPGDGYCPAYPRTREGIVRCFRDGAAYTRASAAECRQNARDIGPIQGAGTPPPSRDSQLGAFNECADLYDRAARAQDCAAERIAGGMQVNPAVAECRQRFGIVP